MKFLVPRLVVAWVLPEAAKRFEGMVPVEPASQGCIGPGEADAKSACSPASSSDGGVTVWLIGPQRLE